MSIAAKATEEVTAISTLADDLWCITWSDAYSFVGRMDGRLYVFPSVHNLPEHWLAGLDVSEYDKHCKIAAHAIVVGAAAE